MKNNRALRILRFVLIALAALALFSFVVMQLWNWLMPHIFGLPAVTFWQALGLLVLSKILLGGFRGRRGPGMFWRQRMTERWEKMTPEERERFRQGLRGRCGPFGPPAEQPKG